MTRISIDNLGSKGIVTDINPYNLPPEAFTSGRNIRFLDDHCARMSGEENVFPSPITAPYWATPVASPSGYFWVYGGLDKIGVYNGTTHTNITRATGGNYSADEDLNWNGGTLSGILVMNNGVDVPQFWATPSIGTKMADLTNWPATYRCGFIVPFKNYLIALNMTQGANLYPHRVLWSHPADPGAVPVSWDIADATKDAGEWDIGSIVSGGINGALVLGNSLVIYKENSMHVMQPSGNQYIFRFDDLLLNYGLASPRGMTHIPWQRQHFVYVGDDLIVHNGQQARSVLTARQRRTLLNSIDGTNYKRSFTVLNRNTQEIWFCYPEESQSMATRAIVYNYETGTIGDRDLNSVAHIASGQVNDGSVETWDSDSAVWKSDSSVWDDRSFSPSDRALLLVRPSSSGKFRKADSSFQFDGVDYPAFVEKQGLSIIGKDRQGAPKVDLVHRKIIRRVWPKMEGGKVTVRLLSQEDLNGPVAYSDAMEFDPSVDRYLDPPTPVSGLLLGIRFESADDSDWRLHGYDMEIEVLGDF